MIKTNEVIKKEIKTVGDLKRVLEKYEDSFLINFGTEDLGFELTGYKHDFLALALISDDLQEYLEVNDYS